MRFNTFQCHSSWRLLILCSLQYKKKNTNVFRSQLPRKNNTYPYDPPPETPSPDCANCNIFQLKSGLHLCLVCGCLGPKACARCHKAHYCSKEHQTTDWKLQHKKLCGEESNASSAAVPNHGFLFPEYEIVTEPEELDSDSRSQDEEEDAEVVTSAVIESCVGGLDEQELEAMAKHETKDDMVFNSFKRRIALEPEQVLRYCRGGEPLWISHQNVPAEEEIPNCPCGAKRIFEFQVMPQLLNHLKVDSLGESIDWGILAVFTCTDNCTTETRYAVEFLWKQDIVGDTM
ncbi:programmed cell death protein 2 isoform X2 [Ascaphus truei]|uniref:programmed cell death protein 2 isoform X2 n=1 Tax=Ascaphus truei TaxID=8439 RepID=UPI003F5A04BC